MDVRFTLNGTLFVWDERKANANLAKHSGVSFEQATHVFFDPFLRVIDASRNDEARDAVTGFDALNRILFVVHIQISNEEIRIISARKATQEERKFYDS